jgi:hypothetical protein
VQLIEQCRTGGFGLPGTRSKCDKGENAATLGSETNRRDALLMIVIIPESQIFLD